MTDDETATAPWDPPPNPFADIPVDTLDEARTLLAAMRTYHDEVRTDSHEHNMALTKELGRLMGVHEAHLIDLRRQLDDVVKQRDAHLPDGEAQALAVCIGAIHQFITRGENGMVAMPRGPFTPGPYVNPRVRRLLEALNDRFDGGLMRVPPADTEDEDRLRQSLHQAIDEVVR